MAHWLLEIKNDHIYPEKIYGEAGRTVTFPIKGKPKDFQPNDLVWIWRARGKALVQSGIVGRGRIEELYTGGELSQYRSAWKNPVLADAEIPRLKLHLLDSSLRKPLREEDLIVEKVAGSLSDFIQMKLRTVLEVEQPLHEYFEESWAKHLGVDELTW